MKRAGMRVLITGASGFLGRSVVPQLCERGHQVSALARSDESAARVATLGGSAVRGDLDVEKSLRVAFAEAKAQVLVSLASLGFGHGPLVVSVAEEEGLKRAIFVSTTAIFTRLAAPSKGVRIAAEDAIQRSSLDWTILRPTMIYGGSGDRNLSRLLRLLRRVPLVPVPGGGHRLQQPVHVADLAHAVVAAIERPEAIGRVYDVAGPEPIPFREMLQTAGAAAGRSPLVIPLPLSATVRVLRAYERFSRHPRLRAEQVERLAEDKAFDIEAARRDLGFDPRPFSEGIREEAAEVL